MLMKTRNFSIDEHVLIDLCISIDLIISCFFIWSCYASFRCQTSEIRASTRNSTLHHIVTDRNATESLECKGAIE